MFDSLFPEQASTISQQVNLFTTLLFIVSLLFVVLVFTSLIRTAIVYRRDSETRATGTPSRPGKISRGMWLVVAAVILAGLLNMFDTLFPEQASALFIAVVFVVGLLFVMLVLFLITKNWQGPGSNASSEPEKRDKTRLLWVAVVFGILVSVFGWSTEIYLSAANPPEEEVLDIAVVGKRWLWKFQHHPDGQREINELHIPVDHPVKLTMTSHDVLHSLYIPAFKVQQTIVPGGYTTVWFEVTQPGQYRLLSAKYSGTGFSKMKGQVIAMEPEDYEAWLRGETPGEELVQAGAGGNPLAAQGEQLFQNLGCAACHLADGSGIGPSLENRYGQMVDLEGGGSVTFDDEYIAESIATPGARVGAGNTPAMPPFQISNEEIDALVAYVKSLSGVADDTAVAAGEDGGSAVPDTMPEAYALQGCIGCHGAAMEGGIGPILAGLDVEYIKKEAREGNIDSGMTPYGPDQVSDADLGGIALFINAATLADTGVEITPGVAEALAQAHQSVLAGDKEATQKHLEDALGATIAEKTPMGVQSTIKFIIGNLELDDWAEYADNRLSMLLAGGAPASEAPAAEEEAPPETESKEAAAEAESGDDSSIPAAGTLPDAFIMQGCVACHGKQLEGATGPILAGLDPDLVTREVREGNIESGMTPFGEEQFSDDDLASFGLFAQAATLADTGVEFSDDILEAFGLAQEAVQSGDKEAASDHLEEALTAAVIGKAPIGVQNTVKFMIAHLEGDDWQEYLDARLAFYLGEASGDTGGNDAVEEAAKTDAGAPGEVKAALPDAFIMQGCVACHGKQLEGATGPILAGLDPDLVTREVREGNIESGMTPFGEEQFSDDDLASFGLFAQAATLADTGVEFSDDILEAFGLAQEAVQSGDKEAASDHLEEALTAAVIGKAPIGVQNTVKFMIAHLEGDDWETYLNARLAFYLGE